MKSTDDNSMLSSDGRERRKPYVAPSFKRLSPDDGREFLLRSADINDPEVRQMLRQIEELRGK